MDGAEILGLPPDYAVRNRQQAMEIIGDMVAVGPGLSISEIGQTLDWRRLNPPRVPVEADHHSSWSRAMDLHTGEKLPRNALDLDDPIPMAVRAIEQDPETQAGVKNGRHLLIAHFQEVTSVQYQQLELLTGLSSSSTIETDPNQSIGTWQDADQQVLPSKKSQSLRG